MSKSTVTTKIETTSSSPILMLAFELGEESWQQLLDINAPHSNTDDDERLFWEIFQCLAEGSIGVAGK